MYKNKPLKEDGLDLLMRSMSAGSPSEGIRSQEVAGQQSFVKSDTLPANMSLEDREALEVAGVVFGKVVEGDELFQYVQLPEGWTKSGTDHSMHNDLLDNKGRRRAGIFYKAAFYDRRANLHCIRRFGVRIDYDRLGEGVAVATIMDGDQVVYTTDAVEFTDETNYEAQDKATALAKEWLGINYPDWTDASAYWD
ncbi:MAG: hypothetical protein ISS87_01435 [Candidatus Pacebacteria bacterium]|nr:hypothetical protein [Candidatus Paceibacterota bacterium]